MVDWSSSEEDEHNVENHVVLLCTPCLLFVLVRNLYEEEPCNVALTCRFAFSSYVDMSLRVFYVSNSAMLEEVTTDCREVNMALVFER